MQKGADRRNINNVSADEHLHTQMPPHRSETLGSQVKDGRAYKIGTSEQDVVKLN